MAEVKLTITLESGNAAFSDSPEREVADILNDLTSSIRKGRSGKFTLSDSNGNKVGTAYLEISEADA